MLVGMAPVISLAAIYIDAGDQSVFHVRALGYLKIDPATC
jgi:hypothetical protein